MEMHQVRYFLAVARTLNFTQAADECHVAQPSLSRAIKKLEEELGGDLFRRERALTHLTDLGKLMLPLLNQCYESAMAAKQVASSYRMGDQTPLRLALSQTINLEMLIAPLTELVKQFAGLQLRFARGTVEEIAVLLKSGEAELAVAGPMAETWERVDSWPLFTESFEAVVSMMHPLAKQNAVELAQLANDRLLARPYCEYAAQFAAILDARGIEQKTADRLASDQDLLTLLDANVGVAVMPRSSRSRTGLRTLTIKDLELRYSVYLYAVAGRERSAAANALLKLLRAADWSQIVPGAEMNASALRPLRFASTA